MRNLAQNWPAPWPAYILHTLDQRSIFGTSIAEYLPEQLTRGRVALVGDAAHVASPMTGAGFETALLDAGTLAMEAGQGIAGNQAIQVLQRYERERLQPDRALVQYGHTWGESYLHR